MISILPKFGWNFSNLPKCWMFFSRIIANFPALAMRPHPRAVRLPYPCRTLTCSLFVYFCNWCFFFPIGHQSPRIRLTPRPSVVWFFVLMACVQWFVVYRRAVVGEPFQKWGVQVHVKKTGNFIIKRLTLTMDSILIVLLEARLSKIRNVKMRGLGLPRKRSGGPRPMRPPVPPPLPSRHVLFAAWWRRHELLTLRHIESVFLSEFSLSPHNFLLDFIEMVAVTPFSPPPPFCPYRSCQLGVFRSLTEFFFKWP